jgi:AcrR family transcriptional regulator
MTVTPLTPATPDRPLRADARRNRARLLAEAERAFAERGVDAPLEDVARRAGVGIGTLYRHFPTRDALVEALIAAGVDDLAALSDELSTAAEPFEALHEWLRALVRHVAAYRGLAESLVAAGCGAGDGPLADTCRRTEAAGAALFDRARRLGAVRPDATVADVLDLASSAAWIATGRGDPAQGDRLLALALDGFRPEAGAGTEPGYQPR